MRELVLTRHNELIDPILSVWGWEIPVYLFLGGLVAGMMIIVGSLLLRRGAPRRESITRLLPLLGLSLLSLGMLALFLDLEHKRYVWRLYTTMQLGIADVVGRVDSGPRLSGARRRLDRASARARPRSDPGPRSCHGSPAISAARVAGGRACQHRPRDSARDLHGDPAQFARRASFLEQCAARPALPRVGAVVCRRARRTLWPRTTRNPGSLASADNLLLAVEIAVIILFLVGAPQRVAGARRCGRAGPRRPVHGCLLGARRGDRHHPAPHHPVARRRAPNPAHGPRAHLRARRRARAAVRHPARRSVQSLAEDIGARELGPGS